MMLRERLQQEFDARRRRNPRYSLRAFAKSLGTSHTTLSRTLRQRQRLTARTIETLGRALGLSATELRDATTEEHCALVLAAIGDARSRPESRSLAVMTGLPIDSVNVALHWLLYRRELELTTTTHWTPTTP
ncbi:MAG: hypothetical protein JWO05_1883 [Gemmatimonadetes bacterium]|nr:hypothetical protein [Gemmatimonadota bacterium]